MSFCETILCSALLFLGLEVAFTLLAVAPVLVGTWSEDRRWRKEREWSWEEGRRG